MITLDPIIRYLNLSRDDDIIGIPGNISECLVACALKKALHRELTVLLSAIHDTELLQYTPLTDEIRAVIEDFDTFSRGIPLTKAEYMKKSKIVPKLIEKGLTT